MKTNEILNQISSLELDISNLDHSDFRELHGLSEEDVASLSQEEEKKLIEAGVSEDTLASKKETRTQADIKDWYDALDKKGKERYAGVITVIDNEKELKIN